MRKVVVIGIVFLFLGLSLCYAGGHKEKVKAVKYQEGTYKDYTHKVGKAEQFRQKALDDSANADKWNAKALKAGQKAAQIIPPGISGNVKTYVNKTNSLEKLNTKLGNLTADPNADPAKIEKLTLKIENKTEKLGNFKDKTLEQFGEKYQKLTDRSTKLMDKATGLAESNPDKSAKIKAKAEYLQQKADWKKGKLESIFK